MHTYDIWAPRQAEEASAMICEASRTQVKRLACSLYVLDRSLPYSYLLYPILVNIPMDRAEVTYFANESMYTVERPECHLT